MKVLVLTHRLPFAPNRGDRIRAFHIVKQLAARADVHVVSLVHDREEEAQADTLRQLGVAVSTAFVPRTRNLALAALKLPTVDAADASAARLAGDAAGARAGDRRVAAGRRCSPTAPASRRSAWCRRWPASRSCSTWWTSTRPSGPPSPAPRGFPKSWVYRREARCLSAFEARAVQAAFAATVVNERERDTLLRVCPARPSTSRRTASTSTRCRRRSRRRADDRVIFSAVFDYAPNADGAVWFARERLAARARGAAVGAPDAGRFVAERARSAASRRIPRLK